MMTIKSIIIFSVFSLFLASCSVLETHSPSFDFKASSSPRGKNIEDLIERFANGIDVIMSLYNKETGSWDDPNCVKPESCINGAGFWFWGNAARLLADYQNFASQGRRDYSFELENIFEKNKVEMVTADSFDDEAWWGLAMMRYYAATKNTTYLDQAKRIVDDMVTRGKQNICGDKEGGIYWDEAKTQVGSIANELLISLSSKIALIDDPDETYKNIALKAWSWFSNSGLIASNNLVLDHYAVTDEKCGERIDWTFTYNSGVILSGLVDLYQLTKDQSYLNRAKAIATAGLERFTSTKGGITDDYPDGNPKAIAEDAFLFKGVFVENLGYLESHSPSLATSLLQLQLELLLEKQGSASEYGYVWSLPATSSKNAVDIITHMSSLYLIEAVLHIYGY